MQRARREDPPPNPHIYDLFWPAEEIPSPQKTLRAEDSPPEQESMLSGKTVLLEAMEPETVLEVLRTRMTELIAQTYRYSPWVEEIEAILASLTPYHPDPGWTSEDQHLGKGRPCCSGWLPPVPEDRDKEKWRSWCRRIEAYQHLSSAILRTESEKVKRAGRPRPPGFQDPEPWLLSLARQRIPALLDEARRRYHAHPWFTQDLHTPAPLLRVRGRLAERPESGPGNQWHPDIDSFRQLDGELVRCAPQWWSRILTHQGAVPLQALEAELAEWRTQIQIPPDPDLYTPRTPFTNPGSPTEAQPGSAAGTPVRSKA